MRRKISILVVTIIAIVSIFAAIASASTSVTKGETSLYTVSVNSVMDKPNASVDALPSYENKENA